MQTAELIIIGAGAAGLAAAIFAAEAGAREIVVLEGARKPGAKILISGGGRCNVTNERVRPEDYAGGPRPLIRNALRAFDERATLDWFGRLGVPLKLEPTGKYFPTSDSARTVLDALLRQTERAGARLCTGERVQGFTFQRGDAHPFQITSRNAATGTQSSWRARRLIIATGGLALPKSGSDGAGYRWLKALGHTLVPTTPALVPLLLARDGAEVINLADLSGITFDARLRLVDSKGRALAEETGSTLWTHFGLSGPTPLNISRHWLRAQMEGHAAAQLCIGHPEFASIAAADAWLRDAATRHPRWSAPRVLAELFPARLAEQIAATAPEMNQLSRAGRQSLATRIAQWPLPVTGDRGYTFAEATAGGIDLREVEVPRMESRLIPGLHLCGEVLDVDGRIGGFNFQWAWTSAYLAARAAASGS